MKLRACLVAAILRGVRLLPDHRRRPQHGTRHHRLPDLGIAAAQPLFIKGVLLMHSFEYDDAREAFVEAQKADPGFAMAYWGEAMTFNHAVWQRTSPDLAKAALAKLAPTPDARRAKAPTEKEKDWLGAVEKLFGPGEKLARDLAYADAMRRMHDKYPADDEVTAFYALAHARHQPWRP